ncbi:MAG: deaminase [Actinobacteria bacterium RBG_16_67_15]|nr:MAG: deaminase [Actinobacteria bacterium RBG_16_67_15]
MSRVFVNMGMSLDGYIAPEGMDMDHFADPEYKGWMGEWMQLQNWIFQQQFFRENLRLGEGGETGRDNEIARETFERTGVSVMGKRMFDLGERSWPEEAPFHTPVFVLTHESREPWERPGGTTFYFVNDGIESALEQARALVGDRDIRISGGADVVAQYLNAGLVDKLEINLAPVLFGGGTSLFQAVDRDVVALALRDVIHSPLVTHLRYEVRSG